VCLHFPLRELQSFLLIPLDQKLRNDSRVSEDPVTAEEKEKTKQSQVHKRMRQGSQTRQIIRQHRRPSMKSLLQQRLQPLTMRNWRSFSSYYAARGFGLGLDGGRKAESPTAAACATNNARVKEMDAISATSLHHGVGKKVNDRSQSNYSSTDPTPHPHLHPNMNPHSHRSRRQKWTISCA
jgi:hypothetical protein